MNTSKKVFYVDVDIVKDKTTVHKGEYLFDKTIGEHGGYKLKITKN